jgi:NADH:ubiquinone oxidoreductase subunit E
MSFSTVTSEIKGFETEEARLGLFRELQSILKANRDKAGAPIRILQAAQELCGYLPLPVLEVISKELNKPLSELYGIVTFYHFFTLVPKGKYVIRVCTGTACYVKGASQILDTLKTDWGLEPGDTTADDRFSLETVRCLGCCGLSPVVAISGDVFKKVKPAHIRGILGSYK